VRRSLVLDRGLGQGFCRRDLSGLGTGQILINSVRLTLAQALFQIRLKKSDQFRTFMLTQGRARVEREKDISVNIFVVKFKIVPTSRPGPAGLSLTGRPAG
jgi:hypothetical protein